MQKTQERRLKPLARHPQIDLTKCLGCGTCVDACPETHGADSPLALIDAQAALVNPLRCVGHGDCEEACPVGAIVVGLGALANDPTIPQLTEENESTVPAVYIAGELSGVSLIKNAVAHGARVIEAIAAEREAAEEAGLAVRLSEKVLAVERTRYGFRIRTSKRKVRARRVVLAIGRRGSPRRLGVSGEDQPKVAYGVDDPEAYDGEDLLVVGGGDSAVEAALALAKKNRVTHIKGYAALLARPIAKQWVPASDADASVESGK